MDERELRNVCYKCGCNFKYQYLYDDHLPCPPSMRRFFERPHLRPLPAFLDSGTHFPQSKWPRTRYPTSCLADTDGAPCGNAACDDSDCAFWRSARC